MCVCWVDPTSLTFAVELFDSEIGPAHVPIHTDRIDYVTRYVSSRPASNLNSFLTSTSSSVSVIRYESSRLRDGVSLNSLRAAYAARCAQLLTLVRDLCALAVAEKSGKTAHEPRARLFKTSALAYEEMARERGEDLASAITRAEFERLFGRAAMGNSSSGSSSMRIL